MCGTQDKNARDLLMHLYQWQEMFIRWYKDNLVGRDSSFLPGKYSWKDTPELNKKLWEGYQKVSLDEAKDLFKKSHKKMMTIIDRHTEEELFTKSKYKWTGSTSLGSYLISATSSHYNWAIKQLKEQKQSSSDN